MSTDTAVAVIEARRPRLLAHLREIHERRDILYVLAARDVGVRYKQTLLGAAWAVLQPVAQMAIFAVVFGMIVRVPTGDIPYPLFLLSALVPWTFFASAVTTASTSILASADLVRRVYFPRLLIPAAAIAASCIDLFVALPVLFAATAVFMGVSVELLALPLFFLILFATAAAVGVFAAAFIARFRDVRFVVPLSMQLWFYATPVVYPLELVPMELRRLLYANPMTAVVEGFRGCIFGADIDLNATLVSAACAALLFALAVTTFWRLERRMADVL